MPLIRIADAAAIVPSISWTSPQLGPVTSTISSAILHPNLTVSLLTAHRRRKQHLMSTQHTGDVTSAGLALHPEDGIVHTAALLPLLAPHLTYGAVLDLVRLRKHPETDHRKLALLDAARHLHPTARQLAVQLIRDRFTGTPHELTIAVTAATDTA